MPDRGRSELSPMPTIQTSRRARIIQMTSRARNTIADIPVTQRNARCIVPICPSDHRRAEGGVIKKARNTSKNTRKIVAVSIV